MKMKNLMFLVARKSWMSLFLGVASALALLMPSKATAQLALFPGTFSERNVDANGIIWVNGLLIPGGGGATFSGSVQNITTPKTDIIIISGGVIAYSAAAAAANGGGPVVVVDELWAQSTYYFFPGYGESTAAFSDTLQTIPPGVGPPAPLAGGEAFGLKTFGSSFDNNTAFALWNDPGNVAGQASVAIMGYNSRNGDFYGGGLHQAYVSFTLSPGEEILLPDSAESDLYAPEPSSISLLALGGLALLWRRRS